MNKYLGLLKNIWKKGLVHILAGNFLSKLVSFFGSIFLVRVLSKQEYGVMTYLENIYGYVLVLAGMGLSNAILRYVVRAEKQEEKYDYFSYACKKGLLWNVVLILIAGVVLTFYPHAEAYQSYVWLLYVLLLGLPFQYMTDNVLCNERAMFANRRYAVLSFVLSASIIISKIISGYLGGIRSVVFTQVIVYALLAVGMQSSTRRTYYSGLTAAKLKKQSRKQMDGYAFQYMITNGLWNIFMLNDTFILGRYCLPDVIAEYKVAYTIPASVTILASALGIFVAPYFVRHEDDRAWVRRNYKKTYLATAGMVGALCLGIGLLARPIVWLLYGEQYLGVVGIMRILLFAAFCNCGLRYTTANILAAMGQVKYNMLISAMGIVMQLAINIQVAPVYGALGVAVTSCIVYAFMALVLLAIFVKKYYLNK